MALEWVKIFSTELNFRAEMLKSMLEDENIQSVLVNKKDSMHTHLTNGEVELYVDKDEVIQAKFLISKFEL